MSDETKLPAVADHRPAPVAFGGNGIEIKSFDDAARFAKVVFDSGLAPHGFNSPQAVMVALQAGMEVGLPPMQAIQSVAVINGRPCMWGDALPALLWAAGFKLEEEMAADGTEAVCTVIRPDGTRITRRFGVDDAAAAGLKGKQGPWSLYPRRMLQMRARSWACRDGAADVLRGMILREEAEDYQGPDRARDVTPAREIDPLLATPVPQPTPAPADTAHEVLTFAGREFPRTARGAQDWANAIGQAAAGAASSDEARAILAEYGPQLAAVREKLPDGHIARVAIDAVLDYQAQIG